MGEWIDEPVRHNMMHAIKEFRKQVDHINVVPCSIFSLEKDI